MAGFKAICFFLLGALAGLGGTCAVIGSFTPASIFQIQRFGSVRIFLAGVWLIAAGVLGGTCIIMRRDRMRQLSTVMGAIAIFAVLLSVTIVVQRRAEQFAGLAAKHKREAQQIYDQIDGMARKGSKLADMTANYQLAGL
jgi:hypothetical protein